MLKNQKSSLENKSYYYNHISKFIKEDPLLIVGKLIESSFEANKNQTDAWLQQIKLLQEKLKVNNLEGYIAFEYNILRLGKRIDVILIIKDIVFVLEFKNGKNVFTTEDAQQTEDYALNIKNFHKESENLYVCPILIATNAQHINNAQSLSAYPDKQIFLQKENNNTFMSKINKIVKLYGNDSCTLNFTNWLLSPYYPTPTIIETAVQAYSTHDISEIARSEAGQNDIDNCIKEVNKIIDTAKKESKKCICFVTGVPGAGKTLVGLDIVSKSLNEKKDHCIYLSGNKSLVVVLREALLKSAKEKNSLKKNTKTSINALIQESYAFKQEYSTTNLAPFEHIIIFDEAQRVWNEQKMKEKHKNNPNMHISEPKLFYDIMNRHKDWAVIVCLVGLGQDIYDGEVGINEWFQCGIDNFKNWNLFYSDDIFNQSEDKTILKSLISNTQLYHNIEQLHLNTSIRSFRAENQSLFVDSLLTNNVQSAKKIYDKIQKKYPIYITRCYEDAKNWIKDRKRGSQRCGVLASSGAQRLRPEGIYVSKEIDVKNWFLAKNDDVRSSNKLEVVASEFKIQGLEIDWAVVCWDQDLRINDEKKWDYYFFRGSKWQKHKKTEKKRYLINSYRVLLTRARQGMVIFVPLGVSESDDKTRLNKEYDKIYDYLLSCGINELPPSQKN